MPPYNVYSPYNYSLGVNTNLGLPNYSQTVNDYNNLALQNQVQKALNLSLQTPNIDSSTTGVANAGLQTTGIQPNTPTGSVAGVDPTMAMISLGAGISNTANDLIYGMQDPMHKDYIFDVTQRGTKEDGHVLNSFADLMFTGNGLWGESSAEREIKEGVEHARDIAYDLGNTFNNANSVESILNIDANTKMPELLTAKSPMSDNGRSMEAAEEINPILRQGYKDFITGRNNQLKNIAQRNQRQQFMNMFANGGSLDELNGITKFNVGGSHSENPYEGIQQGIASDGNPNLVEEGEIKYKDYIYSARLKPSKSLLKEFNLPDKYAGKTFAEVADILQKESEDRPHDPISLQTLDDWMSRLAGAQEEYKAKAEQRRLAKAIDSMSDEEKAAIMSSLVQPMAQQEGIDLSQPMYASGGKIHIKPENRGKFTALKKRTGKSATWFKQHGTPAQKKMATFALNARRWKHEDGGHLFPDGGYPWEIGYLYDNGLAYPSNTPYPLRYTEQVPKVDLLSLVTQNPQAPVSEITARENAIKAAASPIGQEVARDYWNSLQSAKVGFNSFDNYSKIQNILNSDLGVTVGDWQAKLKPGFNAPLLVENSKAPLGVKAATKPTKGTKDSTTTGGFDGSMLRYAPAVGAGLSALTAALQPKDFTVGNIERQLASQLNPIAASHIGSYRKPVTYDVNLGDAENIALTARAIDANRGQNRATQGVLNAAIINAAQKTAAQRNLAAQQANEANRLTTDQYNLGINQFNAQRDTQYDQLNQQILQNKLNMLMSAAQADDASKEAWANMYNTTHENFFNQLGNVGQDTWNRNQRNWLLNALGREGLLELLKAGYKIS